MARRMKYWPALMVSKSLGLWATMRWIRALRPTPGGPTSTWAPFTLYFLWEMSKYQHNFLLLFWKWFPQWKFGGCDQGFAGERGNPLDRLVQLQVRSVHLGVLLESVTKPLLLLLLQQNISAEKRNWNMMSLLLLVQKSRAVWMERWVTSFAEANLSELSWHHNLYFLKHTWQVWSLQLIYQNFCPSTCLILSEGSSKSEGRCNRSVRQCREKVVLSQQQQQQQQQGRREWLSESPQCTTAALAQCDTAPNCCPTHEQQNMTTKISRDWWFKCQFLSAASADQQHQRISSISTSVALAY